MLNSDTKRKIDTLRDLLVGKIPNPQGQVEQITLALIYKFMSDIDDQTSGIFTNSSFFDGEFAHYKWTYLMDSKLSAQERLNLYAEGLEKIPLNPKIPGLFKSIFKQAFLPYRDPTTLTSFLKKIDEFHYEHSEDLGDAFEYLLSCLSAAGDAGMFRTPRHIIDFIVAVVDPKLGETILDPACGTAGFLISAYKYLVKTNPDQFSDFAGLSEKFVGFDISPNMVQLALVNLYLHNFPEPHIFEYDTLTSEDRRSEKYDCILANPPFMTPKGGIVPHSKFGVKSNRSEVLFVDYIMEHLRSTGKAGIIVPEGVIFQSANAYKQLRKALIQDGGLRAVVSLPAGVFNPYSGVKTSILLLDKTIATDDIIFAKITADGYDLGAQRREINKNDLPSVLVGLLEIKNNLKNGNVECSDTDLIRKVAKSDIADDFNLSAERYKTGAVAHTGSWDMVELGEICEEIKNGINVEQLDDGGKYLVSRIQTISDGTIDLNKTKTTNDEVKESDYLQEGDILLSHINSFEHLAKTAIFKSINQKVVHGANLIKFRPDQKVVSSGYLISIMKSLKFIDLARVFAQKAVNQASIKVSDLKQIKIPLPPLEIQEQIVKELDGYQAIIDGAHQIINNWKPTIEVDSEWEMVKLGDENYFKVESGGTPDSKNPEYRNGNIKRVTLIDLPAKDYITEVFATERMITDSGLKGSSAKLLPPKTVLISSRATIGRVGIAMDYLATNQGYKNIVIQDFDQVNETYLAYIAKQYSQEFEKLASGGTFSEISKTSFCTVEIPLPPLDIQQSIVAHIQHEQSLVDSAKELVKIYEDKVKERVERVWTR